VTAEPIAIADAEERRRVFRRDGMGYVWDVPTEQQLQFRADYFSGRAEEIHAEIAVTRMGKHLHLARFNLSSTTSRKTLEKSLVAQTTGLDINWGDLVEGFCVGVLRMERRGEQTRYTQPAERRQLVYLVDHLVLQNKTNMLFAPGGSGKGYLSVAVCCGVAARRGFADLNVMGGVPFYFDWEDDFDTFQDRLNAVANGLGVEVPRIAHRRMRGLAADRINEMARALSDEGANFAVIDSFSAAGGTVSERTGWDTIAHRLFDAIDQVPNMTWFLIDHVTGDKLKDPSGKAYGSIQKMNRVRNAWELRSEQEPGSSIVHMRLFHGKWNHTGRKKPIGIRMEFSGETVSFCAEDPVQSDQETGANLADRMALELSRGPLSTGVLANALGAKESSIRAEMTRNQERFARDLKGFVMLRPSIDDDEPPEPLPW
jgi:hypothetical protein